MGFTPQPGLSGVQKPRADPAQSATRLMIGRVIAVHTETDQIDVALLGGGRINNVPVLSPLAGRNVGAAGLPAVTNGLDNATATGADDSYAVIGYLKGQAELPIALGFLGPKDSNLLKRPDGSNLRRDVGGQVHVAFPSGIEEHHYVGGGVIVVGALEATTLDSSLAPPAGDPTPFYLANGMSTILIDANGAIDFTAPAGFLVNGAGITGYTLPIATAGVLGGIKVGSGLAIDGAGVLSAPPYTLPIATATVLGGVKIRILYADGLDIDPVTGILSASVRATGSAGIERVAFWQSGAIITGDPGFTYNAITDILSVAYVTVANTLLSAKIGIGALSPDYDLTVEWSVANATRGARLRNTSGGVGAFTPFYLGNDTAPLDAGLLRLSSGNISYAGANSLVLLTTGAHPIGFVTNNNLRMIIDSAGWVGIGMTPSQTSLEIARGTGTSGSVVIHGTTHNTHFHYGTDENVFLRGGKAGSYVYLNDTAGLGHVIIGANGGVNLGLGTATPTANIPAVVPAFTLKSTGQGGIFIEGTLSGSDGGLGQLSGVNTAATGADKRAGMVLFSRESDDNSGAIRFFTRNAGSMGTEAMRINRLAYVGIGTTAPATKLQVKGVVGSAGYFDVDALAGTEVEILPAGGCVYQWLTVAFTIRFSSGVLRSNVSNAIAVPGAASTTAALDSDGTTIISVRVYSTGRVVIVRTAGGSTAKVQIQYLAL